MKLSIRKSLASSLMALFLISTIGFNIIVSFCGGCKSEHISIALTAENSSECSCCANNQNTIHCCNSETTHEKEHHKTKNVLAQLSYDSTEAKSIILKVVLPVVAFYSIAIITNSTATISNFVSSFDFSFSPPLSGRSILTSNCILRI